VLAPVNGSAVMGRSVAASASKALREPTSMFCSTAVSRSDSRSVGLSSSEARPP
jgi:hypothetical protein